MARASLSFEMHIIGTAPGAWCDACSLPSGVAYRVALVDAATLRVASGMENVTCPSCRSLRKRRADDPTPGVC